MPDGLLRAAHSHNPARYSHIVKLTLPFYANIGAGHETRTPRLCEHSVGFLFMTLASYIEISPNAFATELNKIIAANTGQRYLFMKLNIFLRRKADSPCMTSSSTAFTPMTRDTNRQMVMAAIGIITELVRKSKKSRNCMPMIFTAPSGQ